MTNVLEFDRNLEKYLIPTKPVNGWKDVVSLPVVSEERSWNMDELEKVLINSINSVTHQNLHDNNGVIYTTLSGGVDSTLCLAVIRNLYPQVPIKTFTVARTSKHPDIHFARAAAFQFGTLHHEVVLSNKEIESITKDFNEHYKGEYQPEGNINPWAIYREIAKFGVKSVIAHDGIDELMGGYWDHRKYGKGSDEEDNQKQLQAFAYFWSRLEPDHLEILDKTAARFNLQVLYPYLQRDLVEYISHIPVTERATKEWGKLAWRTLATKYVWRPVAERAKFGFGQALEDKRFIEKNLERQGKKI